MKVGQMTGLYLFWYGVGRFFIESLRTDSLMFFNIKIAQLVSISFVIIGIVCFVLPIYKFKKKSESK
jgi:phosphatidylglycerol:prolipoprotein diacylglycerol transferase